MRYTNRNKYPFYVEEWLKRDDYDYEPNVLSATRLLAPVRQTILLERFGEYLETDVADAIAKRYGTAIHDSFERMRYEESHENIVQEKRKYANVSDQMISGKFDMIVRKDDTTWKIVDIKSTSVWTHIYESRLEDYRLQLSILAYLLAENEYAVSPFGEIVYVFTDWKASDARKSANYPSERILVEEVELLSPEATHDWLVKRIGLIQHYRTVETDKLLDCPEDELWRDKTKWAVRKEGVERAVRVFETEAEAEELLKTKDKRHYVEKRTGYVRRCKYCDASNVCTQYKRMRDRGEVE